MWEKLNAEPTVIFLLDGIGALVTAVLLLFILTQFEPLFGMPQRVLYLLALIAFVYSIYSFSCYFVVSNWYPYLKLIALANLIYCLLTLGFILFHYRRLTWLGGAYFVTELLIILRLAALEWKLATKTH